MRFASVVLDVDSTLAGIEGIDWLAALRDRETVALVRGLTEDAMSGQLSLEDAYHLRLARIAPTRAEVSELAAAYRANVAPGAADAVARLKSAGVRVVAITGGIADAVIPLCGDVSIAASDVHAVIVHWDDDGRYLDFDRASPLATHGGKSDVLSRLSLPRPILAVGDGSTDLAMRTDGEADAFAAFTGFVSRPSVVKAADHAIASFSELVALVLPGGA